MRILAIETSCDETAAAVVENGRHVQSSIIASSREAFADRTGVIPEEAARAQVECIIPVVEKCITSAGLHPNSIDAIAVTSGPGLLGSLLVGTSSARALAVTWKKPLLGIHHTLGHLSSPWLDLPDNEQPQFPLLTLSASGGHTELWYRTSHLTGTLLGSTRDDAAGEAFDKGASLLGLPYPGGPAIATRAESALPGAYVFPLPLHDSDTYDFSFSGIKTSLRYLIRDGADPADPSLAAAYQHAICCHLLDRMARAIAHTPGIAEIHLVGGVSANLHLREMAQSCADEHGLILRTPVRLSYCTDNAAMIAAAAYFRIIEDGAALGAAFETEASLPLASAVE